MKRLFTILICLFFVLSLTACGNEDSTTESTNETQATQVTEGDNETDTIVGTWVCDDINDDCYFIFEENGDVFAKWGTQTVYGYYDYYEDDDIYEIDVPNFLYNDYKVTFSGNKMKLESEESSYEFEKSTMPQVVIEAPNNLKTNDKLIGDWQSEESYECFRFNEDNTAVITDMMNYATIDCKYSYKDNTVTMYYMITDKEAGSRDVAVEFISSDEIKIGDYVYEKIETE